MTKIFTITITKVLSLFNRAGKSTIGFVSKKTISFHKKIIKIAKYKYRLEIK